MEHTSTLIPNIYITLLSWGFWLGILKVETDEVIFLMSWLRCCVWEGSGKDADFPMVSKPNLGTCTHADEGRVLGITPNWKKSS